MAKKTLILRPVSCRYNAAAIDWVPTTCPDEDIHLLINEIEPDDDATYIKMQNAGPLIYYNVVFVDNDDLKAMLLQLKPTQIRFVARVRAETSLDCNIYVEFSEYVQAPDSDSFKSETVAEFEIAADSLTTYSTKSVIIEDTDAMIRGLTTKGDCYICGEGGSGDKNDEALYTNITQVYLEIDYDDGTEGESPLLYIKQSDTWTPITGAVYKKVNGVWTIGTLDKLSSGDNIVIKEV